LSNIIFNTTLFKVSEKLALTLRSGNKCIECNCVSYGVRVRAFASLNLYKIEAN